MTAIAPLEWVKLTPFAWFSLCGRYVILHSFLPELRFDPTEIYTLRKRNQAMARDEPSQLGYHLAERYTLADAQQEAQNDAWADAQRDARHVPADYPAAALARFYWPISNGCTQAALAIVRRDGKLYAQVIGMHRDDNDSCEPGTYAEIELRPSMIEDGQPSAPE